MMRILCITLFIAISFSLSAADASKTGAPEIYTIDAIHTLASLVSITPGSVEIVPTKVKYEVYDAKPDIVKCWSGFPVINTGKGPLTLPSDGHFFITVRDDGLIWHSNPAAGPIDTLCRIYYNEITIHSECRCRFKLTLSPAVEDKNTIGYLHTLCSEQMTLKQVAPLAVQGLEKPPFCNLTALTIRGCSKLSGTGGALNNILAVMKQLKRLDITESQLDETIIDAEHETLERLNLKRCNITDVRYIKMPNLWLLVLDYNPLPPILYSWIEVPDYCAKSFARKAD